MSSTCGARLAKSNRDSEFRSEAFFCRLSPAALEAFEAVKCSTAYAEGEALFVEGQPAQGVFMLCSGRVKLTIRSSDGKTIILRLAVPGEALALNATVSGKAYQSTAEALERCEVSFVRREDFLRFLQEHGEASLGEARQLSSSYYTACEQIRALGLSQPAPQKLARFLVDWASKGQRGKHGIRVRLTLTLEEISQIIGASPEAVTQTLEEFSHRQLVALRGSSLVIRNRHALENLTGLN
jgi:CRP/FNR family cyclic AMP-dependent transcriptional regulator